MKALFALIALVSLAALPAAAHPGHAYGVYWKNGAPSGMHAGQELPQEIWRFAFVSKFRW